MPKKCCVSMSLHQKLKRLKELQSEADGIRAELGISPPRAVLYYAPLLALDDEMVVVEADGFGGATTSIVEGNYPIDFVARFEKRFETEEAAIDAATKLVEKNAKPVTVLG